MIADENPSLVGAVVGDWYVQARVRPGARWLYKLYNRKADRTVYLQGYRLVRHIKATTRDGGVVIMPNTPWRNEPRDP